jgi:tetratricopeptide (TPR) repeat protein
MSLRAERRGALAVLAALAAQAVVVALAGRALAAPSADEADAALASDEDYRAGLAARKAGQFETALARQRNALVRFPDSADLHNELGYAYRKLGQLEKSFEHYRRALAIDPRHRSAHEYIGEAYLMSGNVAAAERHLAALREICLLPCEEMEDLQKAIAEYRAKPPGTPPPR